MAVVSQNSKALPQIPGAFHLKVAYTYNASVLKSGWNSPPIPLPDMFITSPNFWRNKVTDMETQILQQAYILSHRRFLKALRNWQGNLEAHYYPILTHLHIHTSSLTDINSNSKFTHKNK